MDAWVKPLIDSMMRYIGQTVTIFTTSGGLSGCGFTGVLLCADYNTVQLLTDVGAPPACPVGSCCCGFPENCCFDPCNFDCRNNVLGAIAVIPVDRIVSFTHNAI